MKILESTTFQDTLVSRYYISLNDILITIHVTDHFFRNVVHNDLKVVWKKWKLFLVLVTSTLILDFNNIV